MRYFEVTGFTKHGVWATVRIKTIREYAEQRAREKGLDIITRVEEVA